MEDFDPFDLDIGVLRERLKSNISAKGWQAGKQPRRALPIDIFITDLSKRTRAPKLRRSSELGDPDRCPYQLARDSTYHAALHAHLRAASNEHSAAATAALKNFSDRAGDVRSQLEGVAKNLSIVLRAQEKAYDEEVEELFLLRDVDTLFRAASVLRRLEGPTTRLFRRRAQNPGNIWRGAFAMSMFGSWWKLTGSDPTTTGPFSEYVHAGWLSLKPDMPEVSWESAIRTAKASAVKEYGPAAPWRL